MTHHKEGHIPVFVTSRLRVDECCEDNLSSYVANHDDFLHQITRILSPEVVKSLPPYFSGINTEPLAQQWFEKMVADSRLFVVSVTEQAQAVRSRVIGFIFLHQASADHCESASMAHIGYLFDEAEWGKGFAKECLQGFMAWCETQPAILGLIGGVEKDNPASAHVLERLGFMTQENHSLDLSEQSVTFYQHRFNNNR
ncbi:GNAT family N-acetyltransferase [Photobacterium kagoshimensis]|uniref:GNAT family N-acetyltransferase n=1 Tax=Photobacterium kagoshimensis TaxID=2910242 RepID=UPI003D0D8920